MRALTRLLETRVAESTSRNQKRLWVHRERRDSARSLTKQDYRRLLESKAMEAAARPSSHPLVTITPEMAMEIAKHLK